MAAFGSVQYMWHDQTGPKRQIEFLLHSIPDPLTHSSKIPRFCTARLARVSECVSVESDSSCVCHTMSQDDAAMCANLVWCHKLLLPVTCHYTVTAVTGGAGLVQTE
jgi:hypothetical protein